MTVFIGIAAIMTLLVIAWLIYPLLRSRPSNGVSAERLNIDIHRDQLKALEADLTRGVISQQDFETTRDELQLRLLDDTEIQDPPQSHGNSFWTGKRTAWLIGLSTPALALGIYLQLGAPTAIDPVASAAVDDQQIRQMVDSLAAKLQANPDNPKGWAMLARSYRVMGRLEESKTAFEKAGDFVHTDPDVLLDYAALLGTLNGNKLDDQATQMIAEVLKLNPEHPNGLMMSGISAYQRADYAGAVKQWEKLLSLLDPESSDAQQIQANIEDARAQGKLPPSDATKLPPVAAGAAAAGNMTPEMINQMVERLANRLKDNPNDHAGWARLANAYKVQGKLDDAAQAFSKTGPLLETDANMIAQYADLLATRAKGNFKGQPITLVNKALSIDPKQPNALMMAAQAAYQAADYNTAIRHWETVLTVLPSGSEDSKLVKGEISDAKAKLATQTKP